MSTVVLESPEVEEEAVPEVAPIGPAEPPPVPDEEPADDDGEGDAS